MSTIQVEFSIKDLENLSGIKAHTIRIWESRYNLLEPIRSESNIRNYNIDELKKLLNISLLYQGGWKISKIAKLSEQERIKEIIKITNINDTYINKLINNLLIAMMSFDLKLYNETIKECEKSYSFSDIFIQFFIPLLEKIGILWQTNSIQPIHEHFVSNLVRQKLYSAIENLQYNHIDKNDKIYILFLPVSEIHEIGSLFLQYKLLKNNKNAIFLGGNLDIENLKSLKDLNNKEITYVLYLTTHPETGDEEKFIHELNAYLKPQDSVVLAGRKAKEIPDSILNKQYSKLENLNDFSKIIK